MPRVNIISNTSHEISLFNVKREMALSSKKLRTLFPDYKGPSVKLIERDGRIIFSTYPQYSYTIEGKSYKGPIQVRPDDKINLAELTFSGIVSTLAPHFQDKASYDLSPELHKVFMKELALLESEQDGQ